MPLLSVFTSATLPEPAAKTRVMTELSSLLAKSVHKPESYVMVSLNARPDLMFGGSTAPACYAELKNVGQLAPEEVAALSATFCAALSRLLAVPSDRIYIEFTNAEGAMWGYDGGTFG